MSSDCCRPTHTFENEAYNATQVRLYGIPGFAQRDRKESVLGRFGLGITNDAAGEKIGTLLISMKKGLAVMVTFPEHGELSAGVIFGYAYEGHCFDLPKPKVMLLPAGPRQIPPDDCEFDEKHVADYRVWVVDKLDECIEIEVNAGFVEQLVLEANLPGRRSPTTYSATMKLAHRSGRLTE